MERQVKALETQLTDIELAVEKLAGETSEMKADFQSQLVTVEESLSTA